MMSDPNITSAVGFHFNTLKDCFVFLQWLHIKVGKHKLLGVVRRLHDLLHPCYKNVNVDLVHADLIKFLSNVNTFYGKLSIKKLDHAPTLPQDENSISTETIVDYLLLCLPRFFSAIYYLWYLINQNFEKLGGGGWKDNYPGYDGKDLLGRYWGGGLQKYLTKTSMNENPINNPELIPGGFQEGEIKYGYYDRTGFYQGRNMITDLRQLVDKDATKNNLFRDVFATTTLPIHGGADSHNTANVLAFIDTFCETVETERSILAVEKYEEQKRTFVDWVGLVKHCKDLRSQFGKVFKYGGLSFTGYRRPSKDLKSGGFVERAAAWLRGNLDDVMKALAGIVPYRGKNYHDIFAKNYHHHMIKNYHASLMDYLSENVFPYGFTFSGDNIYTLPYDPHKALSGDWNSVLEQLKGQNGLSKLQQLLAGIEYLNEHDLGEKTHVTHPDDKTKHHVVTTTDDPQNETNNNEGAPKLDNSGGDRHTDKTSEKEDNLESQHDVPTDVKSTSNSPTSIGVNTDDGISEGGKGNGHNDNDDTECNHKVPDMEHSEDDDCFLHMRHERQLRTD